MSVTLRYRHPARPDEARIGYAPDDAYAAALKDQLERRGFQVVEVVPASAGVITSDQSQSVPPSILNRSP
jgi:hypothetical protein